MFPSEAAHILPILYLRNTRRFSYPDSTQLYHDSAFELPFSGRNNIIDNNKI